MCNGTKNNVTVSTCVLNSMLCVVVLFCQHDLFVGCLMAVTLRPTLIMKMSRCSSVVVYDTVLL
jgi:hypothetical protein